MIHTKRLLYNVTHLLVAAALLILANGPTTVEGRRTRRVKGSRVLKGKDDGISSPNVKKQPDDGDTNENIASSEELYQRMADAYLSKADDIVYDYPQNATEYYLTNIEPYQSEDIMWVRDAASGNKTANGTKEVGDIWTNLATRVYSIHAWSNHRVTEVSGGKVEVNLLFTGIVKESNNTNYKDIFGINMLRYDENGLVELIYTKRIWTYDRGY